MSLLKRMKNEPDETLNEINITPLTDCMMVLLIIFMITGTALSQTGFNLELPISEEKETVNQSEITISVTKDGLYYINDQQILEQNLAEHLSKMESKNTAVIINGDTSASYLKIITAVDSAKQAGLTNIGLSTQQKNNKQ